MTLFYSFEDQPVEIRFQKGVIPSREAENRVKTGENPFYDYDRGEKVPYFLHACSFSRNSVLLCLYT